MAARVDRSAPARKEARDEDEVRSGAVPARRRRLCTAAAPASTERAAPPPTTFAAVQPAPVSAPAPSDAQIAPGRWNAERVRCFDLLGASDEDRAAAAMFYYGYLAANAGIHIIDVSQIDGDVSKVMSQCAASPGLTVPQAFRQALRSRSPSC
jgi:hypothetical protein